MSTEIAQRPKSKMDVLKGIMEAPSIQKQFSNVLKENAGVFVASIIDLFSSDKYLQDCDPAKVVMECLKAAVLKLPINKSLGFAYVIAYKGVPQMQIGYKGLIQLAMRTGQYRIINADMVYEGEFQSKNKLTGEFDMNGEKTSDKVIGYFAHIEMLNSFTKTLYMTKEQVTAHGKKYSASFNNSNTPWAKEFDAMAIKTVLKNLLSHYGFLSVEMVGAVDSDNKADSIQDTVAETITTKANKTEMTFDEAEVIEEDGEENPI